MSLCWLGLGSSAGTAMLSAAEHSGPWYGDWKYMGENLLHEKIWSVYASFKVMGSTANTIIRLNAWKHLLLIYLHEHTSDLFHLISFLPVIEVDKWLGMWKIRQIWPGFVFCNEVPCCVLAVKHAAVFKRNCGWAYCDFHLSFSESCELALGFYQSICKWRKWRHPSPSLNHMPGTSRWVSPSSTSHSFKIISKLRDGSRL